LGLSAVLLDTHTWVWSLSQSQRLSPGTRSLIQSAPEAYVAPCSLHEIAWKHRIGKWPEVGSLLDQLPDILRAQNGQIAPYTAEMAILAGSMDWDHRDPFDRMIAATAIELCCPLVSKDTSFDGLDLHSRWRGRLWH